MTARYFDVTGLPAFGSSRRWKTFETNSSGGKQTTNTLKAELRGLIHHHHHHHFICS